MNECVEQNTIIFKMMIFVPVVAVCLVLGVRLIDYIINW
jgi:hypothetical protein